MTWKAKVTMKMKDVDSNIKTYANIDNVLIAISMLIDEGLTYKSWGTHDSNRC